MAAPDSEWEQIPAAHAGGEWEAVPAAEVSGPAAFGKGALQGATLDFADEMGAGLQAGLAAVTPGMSAGDTYHEALRDNRQDLATATKDSPAAMAAGRITGTIASPVNKLLAPLGLAKAGAALGAGSALGRTEATDLPTQALETAKGAGLGMASGGLANKFPTLFPAAAGAGMTGAGVLLNDPELAIGGGLSLATGAAGLGLRGAGAVFNKPGEMARAKIGNKLASRELLERGRLLKNATEPVRGSSAPGAPPAQDLEASARGLLGNEVKENFAFLRSKDPLGLKLGPEAEAGVQSILPDYEATANQSLGQYAQGKDARLKQILANLQAEQSAPPAAAAGPGSEPFLGMHREGYDPRLLPTSGTLKPDPLAGLGSPETKAMVAPRVESALSRMAAEQSPGDRFLGGLGKSFRNPINGGLPVLGGITNLATDPVLATQVLGRVGGWLQSGGAASTRAARFLQGAEGPMLTKKIEFLMQNDPEFAQAVENGQQP